MRSHRALQGHRSARSRSAPELHPALDAALISGSDARLVLDPSNRMNAYGAQPFPRPDEISLSSSTASTISPRAYAAAQAAFDQLQDARASGRFASAFARMADEVRGAIRSLLAVPDADVVLSPSGTDSTLQALFLARGLIGRPVTSIVVAADESGNGVPGEAAGRHFADVTSGGRGVIKADPIEGLACATVCIAARDGQGRARSPAEIDDEVVRVAAKAARAGNGVVLHVMDHSKLGGRGPSIACLREIGAIERGAIQVVVDACQARLGRAQLARYLAQNFFVVLTGSKFFTGPPLSGALLVPEALRPAAARIADVPAGLADYTARDDWPSSFGRIAQLLPGRANVGQVLRWVAAVEEMRAYWAVPELFRRLALTEFASAVPRRFAGIPELALLPDPQSQLPNADLDRGDEFAARTIFPFTVAWKGRPLSLAQTRVLHEALNRDIATLGVGRADPIASTPCHIGQPVAIADGTGGTAGALRISADARLVSDSWAGAGGDPASTDRLTQRIGQVATVLDKLRFLLPHLDGLERILGR